MEFCPKCEALLRPHKQLDGTIVLKCSECDYERSLSEGEDLNGYRETNVIRHSKKEELLVIDEDYYNKLIPKTAVTGFKCFHCGFDRCHLLTLQTRRADEGMTHFLICGRCGFKQKIGS